MNQSKREIADIKCSQCGKQLHIYATDARIKKGREHFFCNHKCESDYRIGLRVYKTCPICGSKFFNHKTETCSSACGYKLISMRAFFKSKDVSAHTYEEMCSLKKRAAEEKKHQRQKPFVYAGREKEYLKEYHQSHKEKTLAAIKARAAKDKVFAFKLKVRKTISRYVSRAYRTNYYCPLIGCSISDLKNHISSLFKDGMTFENYGEWQIDHIIPLSQANTIEEVEKLCNFKNLQPLWAAENRAKGCKVYKPTEPI